MYKPLLPAVLPGRRWEVLPQPGEVMPRPKALRVAKAKPGRVRSGGKRGSRP